MLKLYNSLSKTVEDFVPRNGNHVGMYTCGPTVYQFAHIGNFRAYATADILVRILRHNNYDVNFVMNITDVGHLVSDADTGEDKLEKSAKKEGKTAWEVAEFYTETFLKDYEALGFTYPNILCKATEHIKEQIELIAQIEAQGLTYTTSDGVYFDTFAYKDYGKLSSLDQIKEGARVEANAEKRNPRDFALWKFSYPSGRSFDSAQDDKDAKRQMEWNSPWGKGFPGWHIECSAMSMKYLGESFDIHTGGIDHKEIHHPNEIAQAESVTHKPLSKYWVHTAFMQVSGEKMSKSLENTYTLYNLAKEGYEDPLVLRYLYLQTHYRQEMNFTFPALDGAQSALRKLRIEIARWDLPEGGVPEFEKRFYEAMNDDLNTSKALGVLWELVKSDHPTGAKAASIFRIDRVLGLRLEDSSAQLKELEGLIPGNVRHLVEEREKLRKEKRFNASDKLRAEIKKLGYDIEDTKKGVKIHKLESY